ncbi:MAG: DUF134 domain-containing protein [Dissulfurispiraceae bacterium]|jgi:predicted DNA-binding protein (UPF0251 family)|nr:DUF134 domain-containing protein [Dissulfurispiraceae bacterium]
MSPRYKKPRKCHCPYSDIKDKMFKPVGIPMEDLKIITLFHDELEAVNLCYNKNLTQEEAGEKMGVSRGTVQRLLSNGRKKISQAIAERMALEIEPSTIQPAAGIKRRSR